MLKGDLRVIHNGKLAHNVDFLSTDLAWKLVERLREDDPAGMISVQDVNGQAISIPVNEHPIPKVTGLKPGETRKLFPVRIIRVEYIDTYVLANNEEEAENNADHLANCTYTVGSSYTMDSQCDIKLGSNVAAPVELPAWNPQWNPVPYDIDDPYYEEPDWENLPLRSKYR